MIIGVFFFFYALYVFLFNVCLWVRRNLFFHLLQVKSDFIDAFSNVEKQVSDYQSRLEALNNNFCKVGAFLNKMFQYFACHRFYSSVFPKFWY